MELLKQPCQTKFCLQFLMHGAFFVELEFVDMEYIQIYSIYI